MERSSGVLMHISSLYGDYSCGNFGSAAYEFVDFLSQSGFKFWQVLPFSITDSHNSPYMSYSSFGGNPFFVDPEELRQLGLVTEGELAGERQSSPYVCEFDRLNKSRFAFLSLAASRVHDRSEIYEFLSKNPDISACCEFMALKSANDGKPFIEWTVFTPDADTLFAWQFIQYEFYRQWNRLHAYASERGVKIIGDLPFYVAYDSCDVRSYPRLFMLGRDGKPNCVSGVPPDYFSADGQMWGNPIYDFKQMEKEDFLWWKRRISHMLSVFDALRIDHFRAFSEYWCIPADAQSAREGHWETGPGDKITAAISSVSGGKMIIAENLGIIDLKVNNLLDRSGYPGMSVFQFGFDGNPSNPHLPHNYAKKTVAYTGTHDNNTLLGFLWELDDKTRKRVFEYLGFEGSFEGCCEAIIRMLLRSTAETVIIPIQDLLGFGADTRLNTPGKADGNWGYRLTRNQLLHIDGKKLAFINSMYSR